MAFSGIALLIPAIAMRGIGSGPALFALAFCILAVAYCAAGYLVRKLRLIGGWIAVITAGLLSVLQLLGGATRAAGVGLVVNLAIVVLVLMNWRYLRPSGS